MCDRGSSTPPGPAAGQRGAVPHHRLLNEDLLLDPIRKFLRDRNFPYKLVVNCAMIVLFLVIAVFFHTPESMADEQQRKAVLYHFLGDDYLGKDKGDIKLRPTVYLHSHRDVLRSIREFVTVYYALSNTSVGELKYFYYANAGDRAESLRRVLGDDVTPEYLDCLYAMLEGGMRVSGNVSDVFDVHCVQPVTMEMEVYVYSPREHWGPSPIQFYSDKLTEEKPLGPFTDDDVDSSEEAENKNTGDVISPQKKAVAAEGGDVSDNLNANSYVEVMCAPRLDVITGRYYNPCRGSRKNFNAHHTDKKNRTFSFFLMENVRKLRLCASMRHMTDASANRVEATSGFLTTIFYWTIEKTFLFHPGGLVEVVFDVSVTTKRMYPYPHVRFFLLLGLLLLAVYDIVLRCRALKRVWLYRGRVGNAPCTQAENTQDDSPLTRGRTDCAVVPANGADGLLILPALSDSATTPNCSSSVSLRRGENLSRREIGRRGETHAQKVGSVLPETTYVDIHDVWRQQLLRSRGEGWHYIALVADALTVVYVHFTCAKLFGIWTTELYRSFESIVLGLTGFLFFVGLLSYIRYFPKTYFAVRATRHVIPRLLLFAMSVAPIYFGFACFFCIVFGPHSNGEFADIGFSLVALYFMMFGDAILPAIRNAEGSVYLVVTVLANVMTMIYILFFMMTMLNLAMSIIQHEWCQLRRRFGACLSVHNVLFKVRTREEVRREALESVVANLELLLHLQDVARPATSDSTEGRPAPSDDGTNGANDTGGENNASFVVRRQEVADLYRRQMDELTEGVLDEVA